MFNIGPAELMVIGLVLLIAVGPEQLPGVIRRVGSMVAQARSMTDGLRSEFMAGLEEIERVTDPDEWTSENRPYERTNSYAERKHRLDEEAEAAAAADEVADDAAAADAHEDATDAGEAADDAAAAVDDVDDGSSVAPADGDRAVVAADGDRAVDTADGDRGVVAADGDRGVVAADGDRGDDTAADRAIGGEGSQGDCDAPEAGSERHPRPTFAPSDEPPTGNGHAADAAGPRPRPAAEAEVEASEPSTDSRNADPDPVAPGGDRTVAAAPDGTDTEAGGAGGTNASDVIRPLVEGDA
ncbi:MAG: hypothetical protein AAGA93_10315 [Actinomycetota bacterium]